MAIKVSEWPLAKLKPYAGNPRKNDDAVDRMCDAITEYGFVIPVLARSDGEVIDGHLRLKAAIKLKMKTVPVTLADHMTPAQVKAFRLLANKSVAWAEWDADLLRIELDDLKALDFDLTLTGFDDTELADLLRPVSEQDPEDVPEPPADPVSVLGDVWALGDHRVGCIDSTDLTAVRAFLGDVIPDFANCDPPYGIRIVKAKGSGRASVGGAAPFGPAAGRVHAPGQDGFARGRAPGPARKAIIKPGLYAPIIGDDTVETALASYGVLAGLKVPIIVMWGGNYYADRLPPSRCWLIWDKENSGTFADVEMAWTNRDAVAKLFRHQWNGLMKASERGERRVHPTQKPVALAEWVHQTAAPDAKSVIDLFLGSGAVLVAAERAGIICYGTELAPAYVDCAIARWERMTSREATLIETGETLAQVAARRAQEAA